MILNQPKALTSLFLTELWERFGFFTVQALLILYLIDGLSWKDSSAYILLGEFTAFAYLSPLFGGFLADRVLGYRYSVMIGAIFLSTGYFTLALLGKAGLYFSLATIITGMGLLKPNISSFLGCFYQANDPRRDSGFTIFYMGINIGYFLSSGSSGFIQQQWGWAAAYGCAGLGMLIGLGTFFYGFGRFEQLGLPPTRPEIQSIFLRLLQNPFILALALGIFTAVIYFMLISTHTAQTLLWIIGGSIGLLFCYWIIHFKGIVRQKMITLLLLILASIIFWGLFFQMFFSVNLFTERNVFRELLNYQIPPTTFIAVPSICVLLLAPLFAVLWTKLHIRRIDFSPLVKFGLAMLTAAAAMGILTLSIHNARLDHYINAYWLIIFYLLMAAGEMLLSPIGLATITELAPPHFTGFMMGVWFMSLGFGGYLAGILAEQASVPKTMTDPNLTNAIYSHAFGINTEIALITGALLLALNLLLKRYRVKYTSDD